MDILDLDLGLEVDVAGGDPSNWSVCFEDIDIALTLDPGELSLGSFGSIQFLQGGDPGLSLSAKGAVPGDVEAVLQLDALSSRLAGPAGIDIHTGEIDLQDGVNLTLTFEAFAPVSLSGGLEAGSIKNIVLRK